ncbi:MAG: hypothetical protein K9J25_05425 [Bacteroidales bacterium]|nr:hypothetical protein [Bacteroidales bacterium]
MTKILSCMLCIFLLVSCSRKQALTIDANNIVVFPKPPDTARIQYLTTINNSQDALKEQSAFRKFIFGEPEILPIVKPYGIAVNNSKIYICDTGIGGIEIIDLAENKFDYFKPGGIGALKFPVNCSFDKNGNLYVADADRRQIVVFDQELKYVDAIGLGKDFRPTGISCFNGKIYVASVNSHAISVFDDTNYKLISKFPDPEKKDSAYLYQPLNITVNDDYVYVTDFGDFTIKKFHHNGAFVSRVGSYGTDFGQLTRPKGIATDKKNQLYVVDAAFENVQVFNDNGELLMYFGGAYNGRGSMSLPAGITIDYSCLEFFNKYVFNDFELLYLIFVSNQFGPDKINVYGFVKPDDHLN